MSVLVWNGAESRSGQQPGQHRALDPHRQERPSRRSAACPVRMPTFGQMAPSYYRHSQTGQILSGDPTSDPVFRATISTLRTDRQVHAWEFVADFPGALDANELARRQAILATVQAATNASPAVTLTDYLGSGEATNDRAAMLLGQAAAALAPRTTAGVLAPPAR